MRKLLTLALVLLLAAVSAVSADAQAIRADSGVNVVTFAGATSATLSTLKIGSFPTQVNFCLAVGFISITGDLSAGVTLTWDGQAFTAGPKVSGSGNLSAQAYYLIAPHAGMHTLSASWANSASGRMVAVAFAGADQNTCIDVNDSISIAETTSATWDHFISSDSLGATVAFIYSNDDAASVDVGTALMDAHQGVQGFVQDASFAIGGTSNEHKFTANTSAFIAGVGIHIIGAFSPPDTRDCQESYGGTGHFGCKTSTTNPYVQSIIAAGALGLEGQAGGCWLYWEVPQSPDTPEGGNLFLLQDPAGGGCAGGTAASISGTVSLLTPLTAKTYYIFVRAQKLSVANPIDVTINGVTSTRVTIDLAASRNGGWTQAMSIAVPSAASSITLNVYPDITQPFPQDSIIRAITITDNPLLVMDGSQNPEGVLTNLTFPVATDDSASIGGNLVPNPGFEVGVDAAWAIQEGRVDSIQSMWDSTGADCHSGNACLKIPMDSSNFLKNSGTDLVLVSSIYHLEPNKKYSISIWARAANNDNANLSGTLSFYNAFVPPAGYHAQYVQSVEHIANNGWQQWCIPGVRATSYPTPNFYIWFDFPHASSGNTLYVDDVGLIEGSSCTSAASHAVEAQIVFDDTAQPGHQYFDSDTLSATLRLFNATGGTLTKTIDYTIYNYLNAVAKTGSQVVTAASGSSTSSFDLTVGGKHGSFHVTYCIHGEEGTCKESNYAVIFPTTTTMDATSYFGTQPNLTVYQTLAYRRAGYKWFRTLSPAGSVGRWCLVNPSNGVFVYDDAEYAIAQSRGMTININLGYLPPLWAVTSGGDGNQCNTGGFFNTSPGGSWSTFISTFATHMKVTFGGTLYYEISNEPLAVYTPAQYGAMLKAAIDAIEAADASAKVVCMGGLSTPDQIDSVIAAVQAANPGYKLADHCYAYAIHIYPNGTDPSLFTRFIGTSTGGVLPQLWNTESGYQTMFINGGAYSNFLKFGTQVFPFNESFKYVEEAGPGGPSLFVEEVAANIAAGVVNYQQYDGRQTARPNSTRHAFSILAYDGSLLIKSAALSTEAHFIDHATGHANVALEANSRFFAFTTTGDPVAVIYSQDHHARQVVLSGVTHGQLDCRDLMGDGFAISGTTVPYGRLPVYCIGVGISEATLQASLASGVSSDRTDTMAPNLSIDYVPNGSTNITQQQLRWHAVDDQSWPNFGEFVDVGQNGQQTLTQGDAPAPAAILYSYRLAPRDAGFSAYSPSSVIDVTGLNGPYTLSVIALDEAGNFSNTATASFCVGNCTCTPDHLVFTAQPSSAMSGASIGTVSVATEDASNAVCTLSTDVVTLTKHAGVCVGQTLSGTSSGAETAGVFTSANLKLTGTAGSCSLDATASGLTSATSTSFTISTIPTNPPGVNRGLRP